MRTFLLLLFSIFATNAVSFAQGYYSGASYTGADTPEITQRLDINCDARLDEMLEWHVEKNKKKEGMEGFRVEIFFSSEINAKEQALKIKTGFLRRHPEYPVHVKFVTPNFRVRVGDFRTKNEALKLYKLIQNDYPTAFIVPDIIDFPLLKPSKI